MNAADTAWIITSTALVLFMTLPRLALFYGGLVRVPNVLSVFMPCFSIAASFSWALREKTKYGRASLVGIVTVRNLCADQTGRPDHAS